MPRVLVSPLAVHGRAIAINDVKARHYLTDVLRLKPGDELECFDGAGRSYATRIQSVGKGEVIAEVLRELQESEPILRVHLAQALIRPERFEWVIQKATELGVARITPLLTRRTVARPEPARLGGKLERWRRIAADAARQCGRAAVPEIEAPLALKPLLASIGGTGCLLMPTLAGANIPLREALGTARSAGSAWVLIGPEGDFTPDEAAQAQRAGAVPVSLGRLTLRSETAAIAVLAVLQCAWDGCRERGSGQGGALSV